jgi:penicillin-binding protein 2
MLPVIAPDGTRTTRLRRLDGAARCWVLSELGAKLARAGVRPEHHPVPFNDPHRGHDGNPDGWLTFADGIERSCDVYFETVADRMGRDAVCRWYDRFGMGAPTGIGIHEVRGLLENQFVGTSSLSPRAVNCLAGMGQGLTLATPLQIANAAAAIARNGVWMRPRLLSAPTQSALDAARPRSPTSPPDAVDLHLSPAAIEQARIGMRNAFETPAGTGRLADWTHPTWLTAAVKTGTADTSPFTYLAKQPDGRLVRTRLVPVKRGDPEGPTPWYRSETGAGVVHAWYMGYAPVEDPQVAFAVLGEYAGAGGGTAAGPVAAQLLDACVADGYLHPPGPATTGPTTSP